MDFHVTSQKFTVFIAMSLTSVFPLTLSYLHWGLRIPYVVAQESKISLLCSLRHIKINYGIVLVFFLVFHCYGLIFSLFLIENFLNWFTSSHTYLVRFLRKLGFVYEYLQKPSPLFGVLRYILNTFEQSWNPILL